MCLTSTFLVEAFTHTDHQPNTAIHRYLPHVKGKKFVIHLVTPVYFYPSYFVTHIHWRLLNYSKAVQSSVLLPGVYWHGVAEMAEREWLSDCVWVRGGRGMDCSVECLPGRTAHWMLPAPMLTWKSETSSIREMHELVRRDSWLKLLNGPAFFHFFPVFQSQLSYCPEVCCTQQPPASLLFKQC